ncbi:MAG: LptA/OstA family protein [Armatimonadota bacterium]|nr:LptA/OstA family protein [Armatimonadota bacterium]
MRSGCRHLGFAAAVVATLAWMATATAAAPAPPSAPARAARVEISADAVTVDAATRVVRATGRVAVSDGSTTASAGRATLYHREGRVVLSGDARVRAPQGDLEGQEITVLYTPARITLVVARGSATLDAEGVLTSARTITIDLQRDVLRAEPEVTLFTLPDVVARGSRLTYDRRRRLVVLEGRARVQNRDGFLEADRLEGDRRWEMAVATGGVRGAFRDIEVRSRSGEVFYGEKRAVFVGEVQLTQPGRRLTSDRITVWYGAGRIVAEGQTSVRLEPQP